MPTKQQPIRSVVLRTLGMGSFVLACALPARAGDPPAPAPRPADDRVLSATPGVPALPVAPSVPVGKQPPPPGKPGDDRTLTPTPGIPALPALPAPPAAPPDEPPPPLPPQGPRDSAPPEAPPPMVEPGVGTPPPPPEAPAPPAPGTAPAGPPPPPAAGTPYTPPAGSAAGLYPNSVEERYCALNRCLTGMPEVRTPLFDPTGRFMLPWTGQWTPTERNWTLFAAETITYNSNIFASSTNEESDFISNSSVGASYRREGSAFWALATGALTYSAYLDHSEQNALSGYGNFEFGWKGAALYASISDQVGYLQNPLVVIDNTFVVVRQSLESYWTNTLRARAGYECVKWRAELEYTMNLFLADGGSYTAFDNTDHGLQGRFDYYVSEKTSVGAYAGGRMIRYSDGTQRDFEVFSAGATFSYRPTAKFGLTGMLGGSWTTSSGAGLDNSGVTGSIDASYDATDNVTVFAGWSRRFEPSLGSDNQLVDILRLRAQTVLDHCWTLNVSTGVQIGDTSGSTLDGTKDYTLLFFDGMLHRPINDRWAVDGGYQFRKQTSDGNGVDYDQHRVTIGVTFAF